MENNISVLERFFTIGPDFHAMPHPF